MNSFAPLKILLLLRNQEDTSQLQPLLTPFGEVLVALSQQEAIQQFQRHQFQVIVVDYILGKYANLKGLIRPETSVIVTGSSDQGVKLALQDWPTRWYVDAQPFPYSERSILTFRKSLQRAIDHSLLLQEINHLRHLLAQQEIEIKESFHQIREIKKAINEHIVKEIEKRVALESQFIWFKKEKQKIEEILKKLHKAHDVTDLLDIVYDIKQIIGSQGISLYLVEENEISGKFLKPLVWNNKILSYPDISSHLVLLEKMDYAAFTAKTGTPINSPSSEFDQRLSPRYLKQLGYELKNLLCVPIRQDEEIIGVLEVYNKITPPREKDKNFTPEDEKILTRLSEHIGIAITKLNLIQYDALTGLLRAEPFFEKAIIKIKSESKRRLENSAFALVMGDVDWFKNYNDRNGHEAGNRLLRELARVLKSSTRDEDLLCRYGGEEFLFFLTGIKTPEEAWTFTERIRKNVEEYYFESQEFQPNHNLTMSFGISFFTRDKFPDLKQLSKEDLIKLANEADIALSQAKGKKTALSPGLPEKAKLTKNKICLFSNSNLSAKEIPLIQPIDSSVKKERRRFPRYYSTSLLILSLDGFQKISKTVNLSLGGAKIITNIPLPENKEIKIILVLGNKVFQTRGKVVYCVPSNHALNYNYHSGIEFLELTFKNRHVLEDYFKSLNISPSRFS